MSDPLPSQADGAADGHVDVAAGVPTEDRADSNETGWSSRSTVHRKIAVGAIWTAAANGLTFAVWLPVTALQVRLMSRAGYGSFAVALSAGLLLTPIAGAGLNAAVARAIAVETVEHGSAGVAAVARVAVRLSARAGVVSLACCAVLIVVMTSVHSLRSSALAFTLLAPLVLTSPASQAGNGIIQATMRPRVAFWSSAVTSALMIGLTAALLDSGIRSAPEMAAARSFAVVAGIAVLVAGSRWNALRKEPTSIVVEPGPLMRFGLAVALWAMLGMTISQLGVLFLGAFKGSTAAGAYAPAARFADLVIALVGVVGTYLPPAISTALARGDVDFAGRIHYWASRWAIGVSAPVIGLLVIAPQVLLDFLFGSKAVVVGPARVLGLAVLFDVVLGFNGSVVASAGASRALGRIAVLGLATNVVACVVLIPLLGIDGAAIATAAPLLAVNVALSVVLAKRWRVAPWDRRMALAILALAVGGTASALIVHVVHLAELPEIILIGLLSGAPPLVVAALSRLQDGAAPRAVGA